MSLSASSSNEGTIIISCGSLNPESIICKILGVESLPPPDASNFDIKSFPWSFETKYYSAVTNLYVLEERIELDSGFCDSIRAVIFYFDSKKESSFDDVIKWMPYLKHIESEVQLLVCDSCPEECNDNPALKRKNILKWCVENEYELVELNPPQDKDEEDEGPFHDTKGYDRIVEALQTHTWANLVMKEKTDDDQREKLSACCGAEAVSPKKSDEKKTMNVDGEELVLEEKWLNDVLGGEDPDGESFEALFARFASMKDKAEGLKGEDRKKYAEKVAIEFWRAMGGSEDEIEGLDDSDT